MKHDTKQQFEDAVIDTENSEGSFAIGVCSTCTYCQSMFGIDDEDSPEWENLCDEGGFSFQDCECCGSGLGGDRYAAHTVKDKQIFHYDVCEDCVQYIANGELPYHLED